MKVEEIMTRDVVTVPPGGSLKQAAHLLVEHHVSGLPVVDNEAHVLGVISEADVLPKEAAGAETSKHEARLVGEVMTAPALTIEARRPVGLAARLMIEKDVNRLPVVDGGKLTGIVTRADLVRAFVRSDGEIAKEIREGVVVRDLWLDRDSVQVEVADGEVTLSGKLDSHADARLVEAMAGRVPGVVGVDSKLLWTDDDREC